MALPEDVDPRLLDEDTRRELRSLSRETAELVSKHLVVTGQLIDDDPERALTHARAARALAGRVGVVRLATGLAAYAAQEWAEALSELRAARRITGRPEHLAVLADCERALGRPERALAYGEDPELTSLSQDERVELVIVLAGARRDMGQLDAAVLALQTPARATTAQRPWAARLWYAFADALLVAGREAEAREWFVRTAQVDADGQTDAADRVLGLDGVVLEDLDADGDPDSNADGDRDGDADGDRNGGMDDVMDDAALAAYVAEGFLTGVDEATTVAEVATAAKVAMAAKAPTAAKVAMAAEAPTAAKVAPADGEAMAAEVATADGAAPADDGATVAQVPPAGQPATAPLSKPFSGVVEPETAAASARPAAALTPTFAAPQDAPDDEEGERRAGEEPDGELTLFS